ncbi:MAG: hypothetical protein IPK97_13025 [Ahniella sp.]|nr:hypothetical protein [Ahniella sp.]
MTVRFRCFLTLLLLLASLGSSAAPLDPNTFTSLGTFNPGSAVSVNTDTLAMTGGATFTGVTSGNIAVFTFTTVTLNSGITVTATGSRPFALLSRGAMTISGTIDVSASGSTRGAGGHNGHTTTNGGAGSGPGAGGGDSQGAGGAGFGNVGGSSTSGSVAGIAYGNLATLLEGGSGGGKGTFFGPTSGAGGGGGGALELGAIGTMNIQASAILRANGGNGANFAGGDGDGGGGGSGGALYLHGASTNLVSGAQLRANGGNGGNGQNGIGGGGGAGGRIRAENVGTNAATVTATGGTGSTVGGFGSGLNGGNGEILLMSPPSVTVTQSSGTTNVTEGGTTDTYTIVLNAQPSANVSITISPDAQLSTSPVGPLTFTTANWNQAQTVTVTAVNDAVAEGSHGGTITPSASGGGYTGVSVASISATITDNDVVGVTVAQSSGTTEVTEGGNTDTYTIVLVSQPTATVSITVTGDAQAGAAPGTLSFTTSNWNQPQTVTVTAVNDAVAEGAHNGTITHVASGGNYAGASIANVVASIADNDIAGVTIAQSGSVTEVSEAGATDSYTMVLTSQPTATVTIAITADAQVARNPVQLQFTTGNWNLAQTVVVSAVDDAVAEGTHNGTLTHSASGGGYGTVIISNVVATISDNDTTGLVINQTGGTTTVIEGGAGDTYTLALNSQPTSTVTVTLTGDAQVSRSPSQLQFTTVNWNQAQTVTVSAIDDAIAEGNHTGQITHSAAGGGYNGVTGTPVSVSITDNDVVGVIVTETGGGTAASESGSTDTYAIRLASEPTGTVTITLAPNAQVTTTPGTSLQFTTANWQIDQQVVVGAVDDAVAEGAHTGQVTHTASGANYGAASVAAVTVAITDNDTTGVSVAETDGSTQVSEAGGTDQYTIVLLSQPTGTVSISLNAGTQLTTTPNGPLQFTTANWNTPQTVTVAAIDDAVFEGSHSGQITHVASGGGYGAVVIAGVTATITDNDVQPVDLAASQSLLNPIFGPGERIRFEFSVEHLTSTALPGSAQVAFNLPPELSMVSWICAADPGATCPPSGTGTLNHLITLDGGTGVTYIITADVSTSATTGTALSTTGMISAQSPDQDIEPANNQSVLNFAVGPDRVFRDGFEAL